MGAAALGWNQRRSQDQDSQKERIFSIVATNNMISIKILESIEAQTAQMLPQKEAEWCEGRKRIEDYELAFRTAVFRVENRQGLLLKELLAGTLPLEAGTTKIEMLMFIHRLSNESYSELIDQYLSEIIALSPEGLVESLQQSQRAWLEYRHQMNAVWDVGHSKVEQAQWLVGSAKKRLEEVFQIYQNFQIN